MLSISIKGLINMWTTWHLLWQNDSWHSEAETIIKVMRRPNIFYQKMLVLTFRPSVFMKWVKKNNFFRKTEVTFTVHALCRFHGIRCICLFFVETSMYSWVILQLQSDFWIFNVFCQKLTPLLWEHDGYVLIPLIFYSTITLLHAKLRNIYLCLFRFPIECHSDAS